jgi:hypothetical protein
VQKNILLIFPPRHLKDGKTILQFLAIWKQATEWIWPTQFAQPYHSVSKWAFYKSTEKCRHTWEILWCVEKGRYESIDRLFLLMEVPVISPLFSPTSRWQWASFLPSGLLTSMLCSSLGPTATAHCSPREKMGQRAKNRLPGGELRENIQHPLPNRKESPGQASSARNKGWARPGHLSQSSFTWGASAWKMIPN